MKEIITHTLVTAVIIFLATNMLSAQGRGRGRSNGPPDDTPPGHGVAVAQGRARGNGNGRGIGNGNGNGGSGTAAIVPEIDPSSAAVATALLAGGLLVIRGRRRNTTI